MLSAAPTGGFGIEPLQLSLAQPDDADEALEGSEGPEEDDALGEDDDEGEGAADPGADAIADAPPPTEPPSAPPDAGSTRKHKEWSLQIQPGGEFLLAGSYNAYGPTIRLGAWRMLWIKGFMVGGGPFLHYGIMFDPAGQDVIGQLTLNGDFIIGGGRYQKFAVFFHASAGLGLLHGKDGATDTNILFVGARAGAGVGGYGMITDRISLGALVDFGWYAALGVDAFLMLGFHFGK